MKWTIIASLLGLTQGADWTYDSFGQDWPDKEKACGEEAKNQSPIDLSSTEDKKKWEQANYKIYDGRSDQFTKVYNNPFEQYVKFNGHTSQTDFDVSGDGQMMFTSNVARDIFGASKTFNGVQFHFHAGSEHTINGKRQDLEMHTVHTAAEFDADGKSPKGGFPYAAVGVMFSVNDHTAKLSWAEQRIIDTFFDNLSWEEGLKDEYLDKKEGHTSQMEVDWIAYADLLSLVDTDNRWVYQGSVTTPPCAENVYWNVLSTIYPISAAHLAQFVAYLKKHKIEKGNYREVQTITDQHSVIYLMNDAPSKLAEYEMKEGAALIGIVIILCIFLVFFLIAACYLCNSLHTERKRSAQK